MMIVNWRWDFGNDSDITHIPLITFACDICITYCEQLKSEMWSIDTNNDFFSIASYLEVFAFIDIFATFEDCFLLQKYHFRKTVFSDESRHSQPIDIGIFRKKKILGKNRWKKNRFFKPIPGNFRIIPSKFHANSASIQFVPHFFKLNIMLKNPFNWYGVGKDKVWCTWNHFFVW